MQHNNSFAQKFEDLAYVSIEQINYIIDNVHTECKASQTFSELFSIKSNSDCITYRFECMNKKNNDRSFVLFVKIPTDLPQIFCEGFSN